MARHEVLKRVCRYVFLVSMLAVLLAAIQWLNASRDELRRSLCLHYPKSRFYTTHCSDFSSTEILYKRAAAALGVFTVAGSSGVPAMHAALLSDGRVVFLDKVEFYTELQLPNGLLAYSSIYNPADQSVAALSISTNAFCCGGTFLANGVLLTVGGNDGLEFFDPTVSQGFDGIRYLGTPDIQAGAWSEPGTKLSSRRWYASAQTLGDGTVFVASGSKTGLDPLNPENNNPTYEILSRSGMNWSDSIEMDILVRNQPYFLYPFLHLLKNGCLFVFVGKSSQIFDASQNTIIKELPELPGMMRTYGNTGGSVLLPLTSRNEYEPEIMICGGGAVQAPESPTDPTCGRIQPMAPTPAWEMTSMPEGRCMVEGVLLPDGTVLWLNGAMKGAQGFGIASDPAFDALIYNPEDGSWTTSGTSLIARLYHSVALLLLDGTVLVAGSNPNEMPILPAYVNPANPAQAFPTEFRIEIYTPPYLIEEKANLRPTNVTISASTLVPGGQFGAFFNVPTGVQSAKIVLYHGGFVTHALHMGMRMIELDFDAEDFKVGEDTQYLKVRVPNMKSVIPPGPYVVYVVVDGIPSIGQFVMVE